MKTMIEQLQHDREGHIVWYGETPEETISGLEDELEEIKPLTEENIQAIIKAEEKKRYEQNLHLPGFK